MHSPILPSTTALATTPSTTDHPPPPNVDRATELRQRHGDCSHPTWTDRPTVSDQDAYLTPCLRHTPFILGALAACIFTILCMCCCLCHQDCRRGYRPVVQQTPMVPMEERRGSRRGRNTFTRPHVKGDAWISIVSYFHSILYILGCSIGFCVNKFVLPSISVSLSITTGQTIHIPCLIFSFCISLRFVRGGGVLTPLYSDRVKAGKM